MIACQGLSYCTGPAIWTLVDPSFSRACLWSPSYFAVDNTGPAGATIRFEIIGARPPKSREIVHKVGRTSGWTSGRVENHGDFDDPTCPGNHTLRGNVIGSGYAIECLIDAGYRSRGGDSGSPVFVMVDDSTTDDIEVILVGVHYGGTDATATGAFVPIDRVYAESLLNGYDWSTDTQEVRPILALDSDMETLTVLDDGPKIRAEFLIEDFSPGLGLKYEAQLFRSSGTSPPTPVRIGGSEAVRTVSRTNRVAEFDLSDLDVNQRSGSFSVKVKFCVYDLAANPNALWCGEHGSDGGKSVTPVPAPTSLSVTRETDGDVLVSWGAVASVSEYKISYRPLAPPVGAFHPQQAGTAPGDDGGDMSFAMRTGL